MKSIESRRSRWSSVRSSRTAAWTETSSAEVTSSQTSRSGFAASARAIATRWRSPPDSSTGKRPATRAGSRTRSSSASTSRSASARDSFRNTRSGRSIDAPTRWRGLSDSNGFWNTIWIRRRWSSVRDRAAPCSSSPSKTIRPAVGTCRPAMQRPIVVLPLPDSPTSATHVPASMANETPRTATVPRPARPVLDLEVGHLKERRAVAGRARSPRTLRPRLGQLELVPADAPDAYARAWPRRDPAPRRGSAPARTRTGVRSRSPPATRRRRRRRPGCPGARAGGGRRGWHRPAPACTGGAAAR